MHGNIVCFKGNVAQELAVECHPPKLHVIVHRKQLLQPLVVAAVATAEAVASAVERESRCEYDVDAFQGRRITAGGRFKNPQLAFQ